MHAIVQWLHICHVMILIGWMDSNRLLAKRARVCTGRWKAEIMSLTVKLSIFLSSACSNTIDTNFNTDDYRKTGFWTYYFKNISQNRHQCFLKSKKIIWQNYLCNVLLQTAHFLISLSHFRSLISETFTKSDIGNRDEWDYTRDSLDNLIRN